MHTQPPGTNYADYLQLDDLLAVQQPLSDHPDELHFILIHQIHELWFKLALHHLERARSAIQADALPEATRLLGQVTGMFDNLIGAVEHLQSLPPVAFHQFRKQLAPGSGLQSYQFREIEFLAGMRTQRHVEWVQRVLVKDSHWEQIAQRLEEPSLADALDEARARHGFADLTAVYAAPGDDPALYMVCEALSELDQRVLRWRYSHIELVKRTIGTTTVGTGGTKYDYLDATLKKPLFPALWDARSALSRHFDDQP